MTTTTKNMGYDGQKNPVLYIPMYPQYFYPQRYPVGDGYQNSQLNHSSYDHKDQFFGTGLEELMFKRGEIIDSKINLVLSDIYQRREFQHDNAYHICLDQCACRNLINELDEDVWDRNRIELEKKIIDLEQEKRMEQTSYFRDILFLKRELREAMIEKLEENQKTDMFLDQKEELPCHI